MAISLAMANLIRFSKLNFAIGEAIILRSDIYFTDGEMTQFYGPWGLRSKDLMRQGLPTWQMSDGSIDRPDPSEKQSYGRTFILPMAK